MKKKEYKVLGGYMTNDIEKVVMEHLNDGWELQGGICYSSSGYYWQAVYRVVEI